MSKDNQTILEKIRSKINFKKAAVGLAFAGVLAGGHKKIQDAHQDRIEQNIDSIKNCLPKADTYQWDETNKTYTVTYEISEELQQKLASQVERLHKTVENLRNRREELRGTPNKEAFKVVEKASFGFPRVSAQAKDLAKKGCLTCTFVFKQSSLIPEQSVIADSKIDANPVMATMITNRADNDKYLYFNNGKNKYLQVDGKDVTAEEYAENTINVLATYFKGLSVDLSAVNEGNLVASDKGMSVQKSTKNLSIANKAHINVNANMTR